MSVALFVLPVFVFGREVSSSYAARTPQDSIVLAALDAKVDRYLVALGAEPVEVKCTEADFIISSCTDSTILTRIANRVYKHYFDSRLMGDDEVAIHIYDTWFADKAVKMGSEEEYFEASFFAATNRKSLLGRQAPQLKLYTPEYEEVVLFNDFTPTHSILFFYDIGCPVCLAEVVALKDIYRKYSDKLNFYAVYIGSDGEKWAEYRQDKFGSTAGVHSQTASVGASVNDGGSETTTAEIVHLWDPEMTSDMAFDYGVVGTPRLFLLSPEGRIIGRGLDSVALEALLEVVFKTHTLEYGSQESMDMFDRTFEGSEPCADVSEVAAHIEEMLLPRGDTLLFKQLTGDLLYFLTGRKEARFKCASEAFIDGFILNRPDIWNTADDSLQVVSLGLFVKELLELCPIGEKLPEIEVPVEVLSRKGRKVGVQPVPISGSGDVAKTSESEDGIKSQTVTLRFDKQKNCAIMFYTDGCGLCAESLEAARNLLKTGAPVPNTELVPKKIILVDMDEIWLTGGALPDKLMANFDLSALPFIICLDGDGRVAYKYADFN